VAAAAAAAASVCRAFYKLQEAVQIAGVDERFVFKGAMAIDAGAAPGGWTKYLALDRGCEKVRTQPNTCLLLSSLCRLMLMSAVPFGWGDVNVI
jgi:23S rRNA C2498 (ribose-2'-O)-methylase RlmM